MPIKTQKFIKRKDLRDNPDIWYVFGDNIAKEGLGGQAKEMRGEKNAIGIPTKWFPQMSMEAFFYDSQRQKFWPHMQRAFNRIIVALEHGHTVIFPKDGIGTGLSRMNETAPETFAAMQNLFDTWKNVFGNLDDE